MFTLYTANVIGNQKNKVYPNKIKIYDEETLKNAVKSDYVCATYKDNSRSDDRAVLLRKIGRRFIFKHEKRRKGIIRKRRLRVYF